MLITFMYSTPGSVLTYTYLFGAFSGQTKKKQ